MNFLKRVQKRIGSEDDEMEPPSNPGRDGGRNIDRNSGGSSSKHAASSSNIVFPNLPPLHSVSGTSDKVSIFIKKLKACCIVMDFTVDTNAREKEAKRQTLLELVEFINNSKNIFTEPVVAGVVGMVSANIFRTLPTPCNKPNVVYDPEDDEPALEPKWPHFQIIYELFLRFIVSADVDPKIAKKYVDTSFVSRLLDLFNAEDPRERDYLKTILHRIYGKFMALRAFIRKAIQYLFFKIIYEEEYHNGCAELLEILGSIINGFALPLKTEHISFLDKCLIPLHKVNTLNSFHQQLTYCMTQFIEKEPCVCENVVRGLLRYWPVTNTPKEVLFLNEIEEILELVQSGEFIKFRVVLFKQLAKCIQSPHFQVAERVLFFWNNEYVVRLINANKAVLFPIIINSLYSNSRGHWNTTVHGLTYNVLKIFMEADPNLFDEITRQYREDESHRAAAISQQTYTTHGTSVTGVSPVIPETPGKDFIHFGVPESMQTTASHTEANPSAWPSLNEAVLNAADREALNRSLGIEMSKNTNTADLYETPETVPSDDQHHIGTGINLPDDQTREQEEALRKWKELGELVYG